MRVAAIDCGTNSIRLLVADLTTRPDGRVGLVDVHREMRVVRLGEGVDATGRISTGALDRTWHALADYTAIVRASGVVRVRMAATSATRDAANRDEFVAMVRSTLREDPEVISGEGEAELSFLGAVGDLPGETHAILVADIGGGSTELVVGSHHAGVLGRISLDVGCVRLTERVLRGDPPPATQVLAAREWVRPLLTQALDGIPLADVRTFVAVSGTATTIAAAVLRLPVYDPALIHLSRIGFADIRRVGAELLAQTRAHRASLGYMHPGRVDVIGAGAMILAELVDLVGRRTGLDRAVVSEHDILDGLALSLA